MKKQKPSTMKAIRCIADYPGQSICLHTDGSVRLHANGRTISRKVSRSHANAIEFLVWDFNDLAVGAVGKPCKVYKRKK